MKSMLDKRGWALDPSLLPHLPTARRRVVVQVGRGGEVVNSTEEQEERVILQIHGDQLEVVGSQLVQQAHWVATPVHPQRHQQSARSSI